MPLELKGARPAPGGVDRRYYFMNTTVAGRRLRFSTGTRDLALAERRQQKVVDAVRDDPQVSDDVLRALSRGEDAEALRARLAAEAGWTVRRACDACLSNPQGWGRLDTNATYATNCKAACEFLGDTRPVASVTQQDLNDYAVHLLERKRNAKATVNRKMFALLAVLEFAKESGEYPGDLPKWKQYDERGSARQYTMTLEDEAVMFAAVAALDERPETTAQGGHPVKRDARDHLDVLVFLADVGCRLGQAFKVRWADIEELAPGRFGVRFWRKAEQKGGRQRTIPCTDRVAELLARRRAKGGHGPFAGLKARRTQALWSMARERTHLRNEPECVIHALRHTCATRLLRMTGNLKLVQEWLGHTNIETTGNTYAKVMAESKLDAVDALQQNWNVTQVPDAVSIQDRNPSQVRDNISTRH